MKTRTESDSMGQIQVQADKYWGAQTERSLKYFSIGKDIMPIELIHAYGTLKKAAAIVNCDLGLLDADKKELIVKVSDEIASGQLDAHFPLHVWMTGSGTQTNMNVNEVIANRACEMAGGVMGSHIPIHPNDHVNMSQSTNDSFPAAMHMAAAIHTTSHLLPCVKKMREGLHKKSLMWAKIIKVGRTHMQDATPLTLGQEFSGYVKMLDDAMGRIAFALKDVYQLALGGTAVGTGINTHPDFAMLAAQEIAKLTDLPFVTAPNKFAVQGSHDALVMLSGALRSLAVALFKIANDIRLLSCGPRCGFDELRIPENEPGSSIMPGKVNPTQCEAMAMVAAQVMGNDVSVGIGGSSGYLEMNVYKPIMINSIMQSIKIMGDSCENFNEYLIENMQPNEARIKHYLDNSLMMVTALSPEIGYDKASEVAHHAFEKDLTLKEACLELGYIREEAFDKIVRPESMIKPEIQSKNEGK
ncbi:MAG: class II fumarate hydratase [Pseudomonadota bacterium]|nr:class II fumarate hydratase [Pseudomonadota bacterium]